MNDEIFLRNYRLKIGRSTGSRVYEMRPSETNPAQDGLRITFQVTHFAGGAFSVAEITIYNVSRYASRQMLGDGSTGRYEFISLEAGYDGLFGSIFIGQITNVQLHLEDGGATRGIRFFCKSSAKERDQNLINLTLSPETDPVQIIEECAAVFGAEIQFYGDFSELRRRSRGTVLQGSPTACMNELGETYQFDWMVENGAIKIIKRDFALDNQIYVISAGTGMIGSPVVSDTEVGIRYTLNPKIKLGDTIKLESMAPRFEFSGAFFYDVPRTIGEGYYKVNSLVFAGDSHGDQWESQISCLRLSAAAQAGISQRATR
ncbi:baseplate hub protein [Pseudomonas sp. SMN5]|uniref:baseplate hub protein n=1 Tax=Pseudomonas sp. SMN5 TaxID=3390198 RepID=UPI003F82C71E